MKSVNKINAEDIKKLASMSDAEIENKLKDIISTTNGNAIKKLLSNVDVSELKKQLQGKNPDSFSKAVRTLETLDTTLIDKIKNALK